MFLQIAYEFMQATVIKKQGKFNLFGMFQSSKSKADFTKCATFRLWYEFILPAENPTMPKKDLLEYKVIMLIYNISCQFITRH